MTVSKTAPSLKQALACRSLGSGALTDWRVRELLGGRQDRNYTLYDLRGSIIGQPSNVTGGWNSTPSANGYFYKGYANDTGEQLMSNASITFGDESGTPLYRWVKQMGNSPGGGQPDSTMEVRAPGRITASGTYSLEWEMMAHGNGFYTNSAFGIAVASSSSGYLVGTTVLDFKREDPLVYSPSYWSFSSATVSLTTARPYVTVILYNHARSGGDPYANPEGWSCKRMRLYQI